MHTPVALLEFQSPESRITYPGPSSVRMTRDRSEAKVVLSTQILSAHRCAKVSRARRG